jgi:hypothetical protein
MPVEAALGDAKGLRQNLDPHSLYTLFGEYLDCRLDPLVAVQRCTGSETFALHRHLVLS